MRTLLTILLLTSIAHAAIPQGCYTTDLTKCYEPTDDWDAEYDTVYDEAVAKYGPICGNWNYNLSYLSWRWQTDQFIIKNDKRKIRRLTFVGNKLRRICGTKCRGIK